MWDDISILSQLPNLAFAFALLIARVGSACMLLPAIGETELPTMVRAGFTLALVVLLLAVVAPLMPSEPPDIGALLAMVTAEIVTGLLLGWLVRLLLLALPMAGQLVANMTGLTNVLQPDPTMGPQASALSRLFALAGPVALLASGTHGLALSALAGSYDLVPPGAMLPAADTAEAVTIAVAEAFALAARLASPFILGAILWQVALGLAARLVPQLQVYFAAMPGQILGGLAMLAVFASAIVETWQAYVEAGIMALPGF